MRPALIFALLTLAACGADGPPQAPAGAQRNGITISGDARMGVVVNPRYVEQ